jgi:hypothetical protein
MMLCVPNISCAGADAQHNDLASSTPHCGEEKPFFELDIALAVACVGMRAVSCRFVLCFPYRSVEFSGSGRIRTFYFPDPDPDRNPRIHVRAPAGKFHEMRNSFCQSADASPARREREKFSRLFFLLFLFLFPFSFIAHRTIQNLVAHRLPPSASVVGC